MQYRSKRAVVDIVPLEWDRWNEVCEFVGVGSLDDGKPEGCWVDPSDGNAHRSNCPPPHLSPDDAELGLLIPTGAGVTILARQGQYLVKQDGKITVEDRETIERFFEPLPDPEGVQPVTPQVVRV